MSLNILDVERRILRACRTIRALPDPERKFFALHNSWPEAVREVEEAYGYNEAILPRFRPTPQDVSDCLVALAWARGIPKRAWRLVWWRSFGVSFKQIGFRLGRSDETARRWYKDAILGLWAEASKTPSLLWLRVENYSRQRVPLVAKESNPTIYWEDCA